MMNLDIAQIDRLKSDIALDWQCLPAMLRDRLCECEALIAQWLYQACCQASANGKAFVLGVNGPQGSGKSTTSEALKHLLEHYYGLRVAVVSIDDFYLTRKERLTLGQKVHPLLATRGVPGTHDTALALETLAALADSDACSAVYIPRFDKATDDRFDKPYWTLMERPLDLIIFEGWCIGAQPENDSDLSQPLNWLEQQEDASGFWRQYVNDALANQYKPLFQCLDALLVFQFGDFSWVLDWRKQQEIHNKKMAEARGMSTKGIMDDVALERFVLHYERVTRACQRALPEIADVCISIDQQRRLTDLCWRNI